MYRISAYGGFIRTADGACFPEDANSPDYQRLQIWISEGNTPEPADAPRQPTPLQKLQQLDAENALTQRNLRETIMLMTEAIKTATQGALDLSQIPGVAKVYEVESLAAELRQQAKAQGLIP